MYFCTSMMDLKNSTCIHRFRITREINGNLLIISLGHSPGVKKK